MNREYSDEEIVEIVKAFKLYIKKIVKHSAIDFVRMSKKNKYKEILYSDLVDEKVSLSVFDDDTFLPFEEKNLDEVMKELKINIKLTKREKEYLELVIKKYSTKDIQRIMKVKDSNIWNIKSKLKRKVEKNKYEKQRIGRFDYKSKEK